MFASVSNKCLEELQIPKSSLKIGPYQYLTQQMFYDPNIQANMNKFFSQIMQYNVAIQLNILPQVAQIPI